jgi:hypothetical protein
MCWNQVSKQSIKNCCHNVLELIFEEVQVLPQRVGINFPNSQRRSAITTCWN